MRSPQFPGGGSARADRPDWLVGNQNTGKVRTVNAARAPSNWRSSTFLVSLALRSCELSPTQTMGVSPASSAAFILRFTVSSVSPNYWRRSEWPMITQRHPDSIIMGAEISPVKAPSFSQCMFCAAMAMSEPAAASTAAASEVKGGATMMSQCLRRRRRAV